MERRHAVGAGGFCICPKCETRVPHRDGIRCLAERCPQCGAKMLREGSEHYVLWRTKRAAGMARSSDARPLA
jgi:Zn-finger nucleic acid-binding protein